MKKTTALVFAVIILLLIVGVSSRSLVSGYYANLGRDALNSGNYADAKTKLDNASRFDASNPQVEAYLGRLALARADVSGPVYYPEADYQTALAHYEKAFSLNLKSKASAEVYRQALENAALAYWNTGKYNTAVDKYLEEIEVAPDRSFWPRYFVATDYFERANKPKEALDILTPAPNLAQSALEKRQLPNVYVLLARLYDYAGDMSKASEAAKLAIALIPENEKSNPLVATAYFRLSTLDARAGNLKIALDDYAKLEKTARSLNKAEGYYSCVLSRIYFHVKDYEKAASIAKSRVEGQKVPELIDALCFDTLTRIELAQGNKSAAQQYARKYIALVDSFPRLDATIQRSRAEFTNLTATP